MPRTLTHLAPMLCLVAALTGCSSSPPPPSLGEQAIRDRIQQESEARIKLTDFQKTNGQPGEVSGVKVYGLDFDAQIEFTENCQWMNGMLGQQFSFRTSQLLAQGQPGFSWDKFHEAADSPGSMVSKGQKVKLSGVVHFSKKEKGWVVEGIEFAKATLVGDSPSPTPLTVLGYTSRACRSHLKQVVLAFKIWANDNDDKFPFHVSASKGGTRESCNRGTDGYERNPAPHFQVLSNELGPVKLVVCPADSVTQVAKDWKSLLPGNVSYQVRTGPKVSEEHPLEILVRCPIHRHEALCDGSVREIQPHGSVPTLTSKEQCFVNRNLFEAKMLQLAAENKKHLTVSEITYFLNIREAPVCPAGGKYAAGATVSAKLTCSIPSHNLP